MTYTIETNGWEMFANIPADPETGLFGGPQPNGLTQEQAEAELARLNASGDWPDGRPAYWIQPDAGDDDAPDYVESMREADDR